MATPKNPTQVVVDQSQGRDGVGHHFRSKILVIANDEDIRLPQDPPVPAEAPPDAPKARPEAPPEKPGRDTKDS